MLTILLEHHTISLLGAIVVEGGNQMARIEESVEIKRPIDQVFAYVTDVKNLSKWESAILEVEQTSSGQIGIGTTFKGANKVMGRRMPWTSKVTDYEPNKKWSETISSGSTRLTCIGHSILLAEAQNSLSIRYESRRISQTYSHRWWQAPCANRRRGILAN